MNKDQVDRICATLRDCFISPNVCDSNMEPAGLVDVGNRAASALFAVAGAITPRSAAPVSVRDGGSVGSLTEACLYAANGLWRIADAIESLSAAITERPPPVASGALSAADIMGIARRLEMEGK